MLARNDAGAVGCQVRFAGTVKPRKECREQPLAKSLTRADVS